MPNASQRIIPILAYRDLPAMHDFLVDAFGMQPGGVELDGEGQPFHAEVYVSDGSVIWLHRHAPQHGLAAPESGQPTTSGVVVVVDDVDAHRAHALSRGAVIDYPPTDQDYGLREYGARDPEGGRWYFGTRLERR